MTVCSQCAGAGAVSAGALLCPTCRGGGSLVEVGNQRLILPLPLSLDAHPSHWRSAVPPLVLVSGLLLLVVGGLGTIAQQGFWLRGWPDLTLGIGGLFVCWGIFKLQTSRQSLFSLDKLDPSEPRLLTEFANPRFGRLLTDAALLALRQGQPAVSETILLMALLQTPRIAGMVARLEQSSRPLFEELALGITLGKADSHPRLEPAARTRMVAAAQTALIHKYPYVDIEDVLVAYLETPGPFASFFKKHNLELDPFLAVASWYAHDEERRLRWSFWLERGRSRPQGYMNRAWTALPTQILDTFSTDLTRLAVSGHVASASVREPEIQRVLAIIGRREHNSVVLVGEAGIGKSTLLGGLALRMIEGNVPPVLQDKRLVMLELSVLLAQPGETEQNLQAVLEEVERAGNVILAIPDIHLLVSSSGGALDTASLLGSALGRGSIQVISTARYADFHRYIESNPMLANALEPVELNEVSVEQAVEILEEEVPQIEGRQHVSVSYPAIQAAASLAKQYLPEKVLPTSAISLLDEAASAAQLNGEHWVMAEDVTKVVQQHTGIPVGASDEQAEKVLNLETELETRIVGQLAAVKAVSDAMRRAAAGLHKSARPLASFLFVGPTGTGKTELAKALAALHFGRADALVRFDMSEYQEGTSAYRLIGAPGADSESFTEGGTLTQAIREHPYSLVLLDELEKAHPDVLNLFLQLLDDGRLTENTGRTVSFSNCVIIATSNAGTAELTKLVSSAADAGEITRQSLRILEQYFKPEFINRFDQVVPFLALTSEDVERIALLQLQAITDDLATKKYAVSFAPEAIRTLAEQGYDPQFGARPLRRVIQDKVEGILAQLILEKKLVPGGTLRITAEMVQ